MNRKILILIISFLTMFFISEASLAQGNSISVKGKIVDTFTFEQVSGTSIALLNASDSVLVNFTRCDDEGDFELKVPKEGQYILIYSHSVFAQFIDEQNISAKGLDLGEVYMFPKATLLKEVVIEESRAITIKGDTVEYNADSFKVREFASVEELLKKLPGIEVDAKGNITAHGEKVQKMLVDGDEFFSDDPIVLSKMLKASAVSTVQVFDDKSEQAKFTGVDDGVKEKTLNLKLKDDAKRGMFGKVELGSDARNYWENTGMLNVFNKKQKISVYGVMSNTNKTGLGWGDMRSFDGGGVEMTEDGGMSVTHNSDDFTDFDGNFNGQGLPKTWNGGIHFSDKFGDNYQHEVNADYRINKNDVFATNENYSQYFFTDTSYTNTSQSENRRSQLSNIVNGKYKWNIDSTSTLQVRMRGNMNMFNNSNISSSNYSSGDYIINDNQRKTISEGNSKSGNIDVLYRKKLNNKGRSFSAQGVVTADESVRESDFNSFTEYYSLGTTSIFDQIKRDTTNSLTTKFVATFTEPIIEDKLSLVSNASYTLNNRGTQNYTYDVVGGVEVLSDTFTNAFQYDVSVLSAGTSLSYTAEKYYLTAGGNVSYSDFLQTNTLTTKTNNFKYYNFNPVVTFRSKDARNLNYYFTYNGTTRQPTINQLQPIVQNSDPLNIRIGNMDLEQQFNHSLNFNIGKYKVLQQRYFYSGGGINYLRNAISTEQYMRNDGVSVFTYYNSTGNWMGWLYAGYSFKPKNWQPRLSANINANYNNYQSRLNYIETTNSNFGITPSLSIDYAKDTTIIVDYSVSMTYNFNQSNNANLSNNNFISTNQRFNASYSFGKGFTIGSEVNWMIRQKLTENDMNNNIMLLNAYISKSFFKDRSVVVKLYGNDLLNQNIGFSRSVNNNMINESFNNTIRRYGMLSVTWNFNKSKAMAVDNSLKEETESIEQADTNPDSYIDEK